MLEEKNDNLLHADGEKNIESIETLQSENQVINNSEAVAETTPELIPDTEIEAPLVAEAELEKVLVKLRSRRKEKKKKTLAKHFGKLKLKEDGLKIQKELRNEWN